MLSTVLDAVTDYRGGVPADDDETLLVLHHNAAETPERSPAQRLRMVRRMLGSTCD